LSLDKSIILVKLDDYFRMAARNARHKEGLTAEKLVDRMNTTHQKKVSRAKAMVPNVNIEPVLLPDIKVKKLHFSYFH